MWFDEKWLGLIARKVDSGYQILAQIKLDKDKQFVKFKDKTFGLDSEKVFYRKGRKTYYFFDWDTGINILIENHQEPNIVPLLFDRLVSGRVAKDLSDALTEKRSMWGYVLVAIMSALMGALTLYMVLDMIPEGGI